MRYANASFDACVSALAPDVIPEVDQVVREMRRVTRPGWTVASHIFDYWGAFSAADLVCDTASVLDEGMRSVRDHRKSRRARGCGRSANRDQLRLRIVRGLLVQLFDGPWCG